MKMTASPAGEPPARGFPAADSSKWPHERVASEDAEVARLIVVNLLAAMGERGVRGVARDAGINEKTLRRLIAGASYPDVRTVARLEDALGVSLYPPWPRAAAVIRE
ncbi:helix-turn-helix domain-containing protein [Microbacterium sp. 1P06AB]|uniref:helix-turn-helix domain-containing protein n=1 Tax=Microbacterium sp. 1P06AB TaxID=3132289 RepID=UPI0039A40502